MEWSRLLSSKRVGEKDNKSKPLRSVFEQDFDRIIFSSSFRTLQDKTQVFPLAGQEFAHTRLTHSLEVSSVGRSLGREAGNYIIRKHPELKDHGKTSHDIGTIVAAAALAHDIGNPPFGHAGEAGISEFFDTWEGAEMLKEKLSDKEWSDIIRFEGNAQGFRLLNKNYRQGLRLSCATLGAFTKYPRGSKLEHADKSRKSQKKYGYLQSNVEQFEFMAHETGLLEISSGNDKSWCRHPLAFLVEAADDICYSIIDLEDGTNLGWLPFEESMTLLGGVIGEKLDPEKLKKYNSLAEKTGMLRALAINELISQVVKKFIEVEPDMLEGKFDKALTDVIPATEAIKKIQQVSLDKIYRSKQVIEREAAGFEVLFGLLSAFVPPVLKNASGGRLSWKESCMVRLLPDDVQSEIEIADGLYECLLTLLDYISGLTDSNALNLFRNIKGISLPGIH